MVCRSSLVSCRMGWVFVRPCCYLTSCWIIGECSCTVQKVQKDVRTKWAHCRPCLSLWLVFPKRWTVIWRVALNISGQTVSFWGKTHPVPEEWCTLKWNGPVLATSVSRPTVPRMPFDTVQQVESFSPLPFQCSHLLLLDAAGGTARLPPVWQGAEVHLAHDLGEQLVHHGLALGRGLHEGAAPVLGQRLALTGGHLSLVLQVHLVAHQHHRNLLVPGAKRQRNMNGGNFWTTH